MALSLLFVSNIVNYDVRIYVTTDVSIEINSKGTAIYVAYHNSLLVVYHSILAAAAKDKWKSTKNQTTITPTKIVCTLN